MEDGDGTEALTATIVIEEQDKGKINKYSVLFAHVAHCTP